jgi:hypothetical protein
VHSTEDMVVVVVRNNFGIILETGWVCPQLEKCTVVVVGKGFRNNSSAGLGVPVARWTGRGVPDLILWIKYDT